MTYILAALALFAIGAAVYFFASYKSARDSNAGVCAALTREELAHARDRRALDAAQATVATLREAVTARDVLVATSEAEVRRLQAALVKAGALADVSDAMGGA